MPRVWERRARPALVTDPAVGAAAFLLVFAKAFQQRNVAGDHFALVWPTALLLSLSEVGLIVSVAHRGFGVVVIWVWLGGALGCTAAMLLHRRVATPSPEIDPD